MSNVLTGVNICRNNAIFYIYIPQYYYYYYYYSHLVLVIINTLAAR